MLLSKSEMDILLIAGYFKNIPAALSSDLGGDTLKLLLEMNLLKTNGSKTACRLSNDGIELLREAGYEFQQDKHPVGDGDFLNRRLQSAEIALALQSIEIVLVKGFRGENEEPRYLPSYALRRNYCSNILGMAKFNGFYLPADSDIAYMVYHLQSKLSGFYPRTEEDTFYQMMTTDDDRTVKVLYLGGKDYSEMGALVLRKKESSKKNDCNFIDAVYEFNCDVSMLPLNALGLRILRVISMPCYREKLVEGVFEHGEAKTAPVFDGVYQGLAIQVNLDNNIKRLHKALNCCEKLCVLSIKEQNARFSEFMSEKVIHRTVSIDGAEKILGIGKPTDYSKIPYTNKYGMGVFVERRVYA